MKLILICYFLLISVNLSAQSNQIDSLRIILKSLKDKNKLLQDSITLINDSITLINNIISDLELTAMSNKDFVLATIGYKVAYIKDRTGFIAVKTIDTLKINDTVNIIGFKDNYWMINHKGKTAYIKEQWLSSDGRSIRENFKKKINMQRLAKKAVTDSPKIRLIATVREGSVIHSEPNILSPYDKIIIPIEIGVIDFDEDYYQIVWGDTVGYVDNIFIKETIEVKEFKKLILAEKEAPRKKELMRIKAERQKELMRIEAERQAIAVKRKKKLVTKYGQQIANKIISKKIWLGMTDDMAIESWGYPHDKNSSVGSWGVNEQWVYGKIKNRKYLYFENGKLTSYSY